MPLYILNHLVLYEYLPYLSIKDWIYKNVYQDNFWKTTVVDGCFIVQYNLKTCFQPSIPKHVCVTCHEHHDKMGVLNCFDINVYHHLMPNTSFFFFCFLLCIFSNSITHSHRLKMPGLEIICTICLAELALSDMPMQVLDCGHVFYKDWLVLPQ